MGAGAAGLSPRNSGGIRPVRIGAEPIGVDLYCAAVPGKVQPGVQHNAMLKYRSIVLYPPLALVSRPAPLSHPEPPKVSVPGNWCWRNGNNRPKMAQLPAH